VQGGTFYNEAVLRAFEQEMGVNVIRPSIAGLMGAFGAALYGRAHARKESTLLSAQALETFTQQAKSVKCGLCGNHCQLTVNTFPGGRRFISGNRCDRPITHRTGDDPLNLYAYKLSLLAQYGEGTGTRGIVGMPMCLSFYELFPFWHFVPPPPAGGVCLKEGASGEKDKPSVLPKAPSQRGLSAKRTGGVHLRIMLQCALPLAQKRQMRYTINTTTAPVFR